MQPEPGVKSRAAPASAQRPTRVGYFLRHSGNLHYFASIKPYLDYFLRLKNVENCVLVPNLLPGWQSVPEFLSYTHLFTSDRSIDDCELVVTPTFLRPEDRPGPRNSNTRVVQIFHGMSDKPFTYERDFEDYALCLCAGQRQVDRLLGHEHNRHIRWVIVGYPKFDNVRLRMLKSGRKTVIYCPTWQKGGVSSIECFLDGASAVAALGERYNIVVKPHPNIFNPARPHFDQSIVDRLERLTGIRLVRSGNVMPWFAQADLFIGDISAAGYEWLYFNRPMIFLNPRPGELRPSRDIQALTYLWQAGEVCDDIDELPAAIERAFAVDKFAQQREAILHYSVYRPRDGFALKRALAAIQRLLASELSMPESCHA